MGQEARPTRTVDPEPFEDLIPGLDTAGDDMDEMTDGDRQLTTNSNAIDGGNNDSDLGDNGIGTRPRPRP